ncbi:MAG: GNVR domain-containing protein, partial [Gemmatimonadota bacterium]
MSPILPIQREARQVQPGGYPSSPDGEQALAGLAGIVRRRRISIVVCLVLSIVLVGLYTLLSTPVYEASSVLRFEPEQINLPQLVQQLATENRIATEIEVLQRRSAAVAAIDSLGLRASVRKPRRAQVSELFTLLRVAPAADTLTLLVRPEPDGRFAIRRPESAKDEVSARIGDTVHVMGVTLALRPRTEELPELELGIASLDQAVRSFAAALKVSRPARDVDLIAVQVRGSDPGRATATANLLAAQLITRRQDLQLARTGSAVKFLRQQVTTLGTQLRNAEDALRSYRERAGVVDAPEQARTQVGRLTQTQADRGAVEAERQALAMLLEQIRSDSSRALPGGEGPSRRLVSFPTLFRNQAASQLLGSLAQVENERAALLMRRTPQDPDVQMLTNRVHQLESQLEGVAETYLQGLTNQVASLDKVGRGFGRALDSLPRKETQTSRLEREVRVQQDLYTLIQTRLKEAEITQAMEDPTVRIVDAAVVPDRPLRPKPLINFALSLVLGTMLGMATALGREFTDHSVRSRAQALHAAGLPILGAIPRLRRRLTALPKPAWRSRNRIGRSPESRDLTQSAVGPETGRAAARIASQLVTLPDAPAGYVESFNQLHANLALTYQERPIKVVVFTSPLPGEGKTLSAINFALTVASRGGRVLLIDADLRCGLVNEVLQCARAPGLAEILTGVSRFEYAAQRIPIGTSASLTVLPAGAHSETPGRLLVLDRVREVLDE